MKKTPLEKVLQVKILKDLKSLGRYCTYYKNIKTSENGIPDVYFTTCLTRSVFVELKRKGEEAKRLQVHKIRKLNECGTRAFVCNSWEEWVKIKRKLEMAKWRIALAHDNFNGY